LVYCVFSNLLTVKVFDKVWDIIYNVDIHKALLQVLQSEKKITHICIELNNMKIYSDGNIFEEIFAISENYIFFISCLQYRGNQVKVDI